MESEASILYGQARPSGVDDASGPPATHRHDSLWFGNHLLDRRIQAGLAELQLRHQTVAVRSEPGNGTAGPGRMVRSRWRRHPRQGWSCLSLRVSRIDPESAGRSVV